MSRRSYNQYCSLARALDIVGERWTLLVIRELLIGPRRYRDLHKNLKGIGTNLLADRLKEMEFRELIEKVIPKQGNKSVGYRLTSLGRELEPVVNELVRWGIQFLGVKKPDELNRPEWDLVALKAFFLPGFAKKTRLHAICNLESDGFSTHMAVKGESLTINPGWAENPTCTIKGNKDILTALFSQELTVKEAERDGLLTIEGDRKSADKLFQCFLLPRF